MTSSIYTFIDNLYNLRNIQNTLCNKKTEMLQRKLLHN